MLAREPSLASSRTSSWSCQGTISCLDVDQPFQCHLFSCFTDWLIWCQRCCPSLQLRYLVFDCLTCSIFACLDFNPDIGRRIFKPSTPHCPIGPKLRTCKVEHFESYLSHPNITFVQTIYHPTLHFVPWHHWSLDACEVNSSGKT